MDKLPKEDFNRGERRFFRSKKRGKMTLKDSDIYCTVLLSV